VVRRACRTGEKTLVKKEKRRERERVGKKGNHKKWGTVVRGEEKKVKGGLGTGAQGKKKLKKKNRGKDTL